MPVRWHHDHVCSTLRSIVDNLLGWITFSYERLNTLIMKMLACEFGQSLLYPSQLRLPLPIVFVDRNWAAVKKEYLGLKVVSKCRYVRNCEAALLGKVDRKQDTLEI